MKNIRSFVTTVVLLAGALSAQGTTVFSSKTKSIKVGGEVGVVHVTVRDGGHLLGEPYVIEMRPTCGQLNQTVASLKVRRSKSVCNVFPDSIALSEDQQTVTIRVQKVDYHYQSVYALAHPNEPIKTRCLPEVVQLSFDLANICKRP